MCTLALVMVSALQAQTTLYWDKNGRTAGAGSPLDGTWTTATTGRNWSSNSAGSGVNTTAWVAGSNAVFSAGTAPASNYTVTVSGTQSVANLTVEEGNPTISGGSLGITGTITVNSGTSATLSSVITGTPNVSVNAGGTLALNGGTFAFTTLNLSGGTLSLKDVTTTVSTLNITGNSVIDFNNTTTTTLTSTNLNISAGATLTVMNWLNSGTFVVTQTINGQANNGPSDLVGGVLSPITFNNYNGMTTTWVFGNHNGWFDHEVRPTPEPATYGAIFLAGCFVLIGYRRFRTSQESA